VGATRREKTEGEGICKKKKDCIQTGGEKDLRWLSSGFLRGRRSEGKKSRERSKGAGGRAGRAEAAEKKVRGKSPEGWVGFSSRGKPARGGGDRRTFEILEEGGQGVINAAHARRPKTRGRVSRVDRKLAYLPRRSMRGNNS